MKNIYKNFEIEIFNDANYCLNSTSNFRHYQNVYFEGKHQEDKFHSTSKHAVIVKENGIEISNVILCEVGGATGIDKNSFIIDDDKIWICVCNKIYCLEIPTLKLVWYKEFDWATNFAIYKLEKDFIIHGESEIFRITQEGGIVWRFGGRDIWVNNKDQKEFNIENNTIRLFDFQSNEYVIDFDGNQTIDNPRVIVIEAAKRKWWKIFKN